MTLAKKTKDEVKAHLWSEADRLDWARLSAAEKARLYTEWTNDPKLGGKLASFMDPRQVRVYIKDTLLKAYTRERSGDFATIRTILSVSGQVTVAKEFIKPHGRLLSDGTLIAWSRAAEWKLTLMSLYERASNTPGAVAEAAIFSDTSPKFVSEEARDMVEDAARRLAIRRLIWLD